MIKLIFILLSTFNFFTAFSQNDFFVFKKNSETIALFRRGSYLAFQDKNQQWQTGYISKIQADSFWIKPMIVHYGLMGNDTINYPPLLFTFDDVYAMPKKGVEISYINGQFQVDRSGGHIHWYWVKSGWVFRTGAIGYAGLNVANGIIKNNFSFTGSRLGLAATAFLFGAVLHHTYKFVLPIGKKYHFLSISTPK